MLARTLDRLSWPLAVTVVLWSLTLLWDASALDVRVMQAIGTAQGFALRNHPWLQQYLHDDVRWLAWGVYALLWVGCIKPAGPWAQWSRSERWLMLWGITLALLSVTLLKRQSLTSCPWELSDFGGTAHYVSHWTWGVRDGGSGHCFPGGHASTAMAFLALALPGLHHPERRQQQRALKLLAAIAGLGLLLGRRANPARRALPQPHAVDRHPLLEQRLAELAAVAPGAAGVATRGAPAAAAAASVTTAR